MADSTEDDNKKKVRREAAFGTQRPRSIACQKSNEGDRVEKQKPSDGLPETIQSGSMTPLPAKDPLTSFGPTDAAKPGRRSTRTYRAKNADLAAFATGKPEPKNNLAEESDTIERSQEAAEAPPKSSETAVPKPVRSTWNLRIRRRSVEGYVSGISNPLPDDPSQAKGLQSAFVIDEDSPEYEIKEEPENKHVLGEGAMGVVYKARQLSLNRDLAIKTLKPASDCPDYDQAAFVSEAVVTANLVHPNIVPIHELGRTVDGKLFYSMKKVDGTPWHRLIDELSVEKNLEILLKVCDAVAFAHDKGVINRDLKPENVIVGKFGEVVVLDWGLAIPMEKFEKKNSLVVEFRGRCGTAEYMAPELLNDDIRHITTAADIYLLGAILFDILEKRPPGELQKYARDFADPEDENTISRILNAWESGVAEDDIRNPGELMQIARKAMAFRPSQRYASVEEFQDAIREYRITGRAEEIMNSIDTNSKQVYVQYQTALALYSDALLKWPDNRRALEGKRRGSLEYAKLARKRGDYDLGLQVVGGDEDAESRTVVKSLKRASRIRAFVRWTWGVTSVAAIVAMVTALIALMENEQLYGNVVALKEKKSDLLETTARLEDKTNSLERETLRLAAEKNQLETDKTNWDTERHTLEVEKTTLKAQTTKLATAKTQLEATNLTLNCQLKANEQVLIQQAAAVDELTSAAKEQKAAASEAEKARMRAKVEGLDAQISAFQAIENWEKIIEVCGTALDADDFKENIYFNRELFKDHRDKARQHLGNSEVPLGFAPQKPGISGDGKTVATIKPGTPTKLVVHYFANPDAEPQILSTNLPNLGAAKNLAVSPDGSAIAVLTKESLRIFRRDNSGLKELNVPESSVTGPSEFNWMSALFTQDGRFLFLVSADKSLLTHVYRLDGTTIRLVSAPGNSLGGGNGDAFAPKNGQVLLLPDASSLIVYTKAAGCKAVPIEWNADRTVPSFPTKLTDRDCPSDQGEFKEKMNIDFLKLSPDGQYLAAGLGRRTEVSNFESDPKNSYPGNVILYPLRAGRKASEFPFDLNGKKRWIPCKFEPTEISFSIDISRLVTLHSVRGVNFMSLWDLKGDGFVACKERGLFEHFSTVNGRRVEADRSLNGHSELIKTAAFIDGGPDRLVSVSADETIRTWSVSNYAKYKAQFEELRQVLRQPRLPENSAAVENKSRSTPIDIDNVFQPRISLQKFGQPILTGMPIDESEDSAKPIPSKAPEGTRVFSARFNSDGSRVLVTSNLRSAQVFDTATGKPVTAKAPGGRRDLFYDSSREATLDKFVEGHSAELSCIRFVRPDGKFLLTEDYYGSISVWDSLLDENGAGQEVCRLLSESASSEFAISDDGLLVLAGGAEVVKTTKSDGTPNDQQEYFGALWDLSVATKTPSPSPRLVLRGGHPKYSITTVDISPSSKRVVTAGRRGRIVIWNAEDGSIIAETDGAHGADQVSGIFFEDEQRLVSSGYDGKLIRWTIDGNALTQTEIRRTNDSANPDYIIRLRPSADRRKFATTEVRIRKENAVRVNELLVNIWLPDGQRKLIKRPEKKNGDAFESDLSWSADGGEFMVMLGGDISVFETETWRLTSALRPSASFAKALRGDFSPSSHDGKKIIATIGDNRIAHLWNMTDKIQMAEFRAQEDYSVIASYSSDQNFVATGSETIRIYAAGESSQQIGTTLFRVNERLPHQSPIADVRFSPAPDDLRLASIDFDGLIQVWNWNATFPTHLEPLGEPRLPQQKPKNIDFQPGNHVVWSQDGHLLAAIQSGKVSILQLRDSDSDDVAIEEPDDENHEYMFNDLAFSPDGDLLAAVGLSRNPNTESLSAAMIVWKQTADAGFQFYSRDYASLSENSQHSVSEESKSKQRGITAVAFRGDREILTGGADARLILWALVDDPITGNVLLQFNEDFKGDLNALLARPGNVHEGALTEIEVSRSGKMVTADDRGSFILWPARRQ